MAKIVGFTGGAGVGKDTAANWLLTYHKTQFRSLAFADPIRAAMKAVFGWDDSHFTQENKNTVDERYGVSPRKAMQTLGTEWGRNLINTDLWLIKAGEKAFPLIDSGFDTLITDTRFENEASWIRKNGGIIVHIDRDVAKLAGEDGKHASEAGIKFVKGDIRINNNEVMSFLQDQLEVLAGVLRQESETVAA